MLAPGITYDAVEAAFVGYALGALTCGQAAFYQLGLTGIPITNVNNNCTTGEHSALPSCYSRPRLRDPLRARTRL